MSEVERTSILLELVSHHTAAVVGHGASHTIDAQAQWRQLGIYQKFANELRDRLSEAMGLRLPATSFFDYPTPASLVEYLEAELLGKRAAADVVAPERSALDDDQIAIVGMGCRYPGGVRSPEDLWKLVIEERDAISELPENRGWDIEGIYDPEPGRLGKTYTREGGFLHDVDQFDPAFFGISPREATALDPQQRVLLDTSWEAIERAGIDPASLRGTRAGVFVGIAYQDYGPNWHEPPKDFNGHLLLGSLTSAASGRIAYTLGLEGPALTVDTACSSSLVALHLACHALRRGECSLALTGGATVMATPGVFLEFSAKRGLSKSGRCKSFSADADGTGWGEGAGMLLLERLSDARRNGHRVLAIVRATALNQDGASNGLTAPNGPAQKRVIRQALANAGLTSAEVDAVDAHGTGTALGDPIEAQALLATYGQERPADKPLMLGSFKSNIGHTQAAAAVGSVIKMVMAMEHGVLPKTLNVAAPSPHIDWSAGAVSLLTEARPWHREGHPRRCGISAFGVSGTNGHVILEEAPSAHVRTPALNDEGDEITAEHEIETIPPASGVADCEPWAMPMLPCIVSGKSAPALRAQAEKLRGAWDAHPEWDVTDVGYSLTGRSHFKHRAVLFAADRESALRGLEVLSNEGTAANLVHGAAQPGGKLAFLFTGQGSQRLGMGRALYDVFPPFAIAFDAACYQLSEHLGRSLRDIIFADEGSEEAALLDQTMYTQTALFAVEVGLFRLMEAWGITPDFLIGHSIGELTAAHVAGVLSLEDACALVAARGRLMQACRPGGAMVAIQGNEDEVAASLAGLEGKVDIATVNGPLSTVIAGDEEAAMLIAEKWQAQGRKVKRLRVSHAFHSPHMEEMLDEFRRVAEAATFAPPSIPIVSNVTGELGTAMELGSADYWVRHVRHAVRFFDGMRSLQTKGVTTFFELGPDAVLTAMGQGCLTEEHAERAMFVSALRARRSEVDTLTNAVAQLYVRGVDVNWRAAFTGRDARRVDLPTYAFQQQRYWLDAPNLGADGPRSQTASADGWRYRVAWKQTADAIRTLAGTWLVFAPQMHEQGDFGLLAWLTSGLAGRGGRVRLIALEGEVDRARLEAELEKVLTSDITVGGVLSLFGLDESPHAQHGAISRGVAHTAALAQVWAAKGVDAPLWCLTQGAVAVGETDSVRSPGQAMIWGMGRALGLEQPKRWGGLIDLPALLDERALRDLCGALSSRDGEDQCAVRSGGVFVRRLLPAEGTSAGLRPWKPRGTTLITGGTGAIGAHAARWLAKNGAEHLLLVSRRGVEAPGAAELMAELAALGTRVTIAACDVADRNSVASLLASLENEPQLTAVVHAAGVAGRFAHLDEVPLDEFASVVSGKVAGAIHLDALLGDRPLDAFVMMSSIAGIWGSGGQTAYSAGNAFLDALAENRRSRGLAGSTVAWGPWAEEGMAADASIKEHLERCGLVPMGAKPATEALWQAVARGEATTTVVNVDWDRFVPTFSAGRKSRLFDDMPGSQPTETAAASEQASASWQQRIRTLPSDAERDSAILELVRTHAAAILGYGSPGDVDPDARFLDLGFDSLASVDLRKRLANASGLRLPATVVFDHPTATSLTACLKNELAQQSDGPAPESVGPSSMPMSQRSPSSQRDPGMGAIRFLYRDAADRGMLDEGFDLLKAAAKLRPVFREPSQLGKILDPIQLAEGPAKPTLVCFPPFVAPSGPHNYARLALHFEGLLDVRAFSLPGFGDGDPLPGSSDLIIDMLAESIARNLGDRPVALVGYSSGGWFAHGVAERLEQMGVNPRAVVLLDSLSLKGERWGKVRAPLRNMAINERAFGLVTDDQLTGMAAYMVVFDGWKPNPIKTPIVVVRARECIPEWEGDRLTDDFWRGSWDMPHEILEVPGDHFTIVNENANTTALAIHEWFSKE
ncbi:type I polyketide synthase [Pendulispora rubella]|uniref:type I polyketide synthase n=1 Tax=Pendulispora rubella TaxID=2741070 RepID=UPI0030E56E18